MSLDVTELTKSLINYPSVSQDSNVAIAEFLAAQMQAAGFEVERLEYTDEKDQRKVNLVGQLAEGCGGLAFFSHSDTVPGQEDDWQAFEAVVRNGKIYGRGSCDMKGPLAATLVAAARFDPQRLRQPVFLIITADEEIGGRGARQVAAHSQRLAAAGTKLGVIAEPTQLRPVYAHKGYCVITVTAQGRSAHSSTDEGVSANFLIAPFLAEMSELAGELKRDPVYMNQEFTPPTNGFNMTLNDSNCAQNVTAAQSVCTLGFRTMPNDGTGDIIAKIGDKARRYGFDFTHELIEPYYISPDAEIVQLACRVTGHKRAQTVSYGTDAFFLKEKFDCVVLGPGDIKMAHTVNECIEVSELKRAVHIYEQMITAVCLDL